MTPLPEPVAVIGGTGDFGRGFCRHLARAGVRTLIGSREAERARETADALHGEGPLSGADNAEALERAGMVLLTLPFSARDALLEPHADALRDKTVVDTSVPLDPDSLQYDPPEAGSAALELQRWLDDGSVRLVSGFHSLGAHALERAGTPASDVFYCGDPEGKRRVRTLLERLAWSGHDAGDLQRSSTLERLAPLMIHFNRHYERRAMGLKLVDEGG